MKKLRLKKKNCAIALLIIFFIIFELINPIKIIAINKLTSLGYSRETSKKIISLGLKNKVASNNYSKFIDLNINDNSFNKLNYDTYKDINYNEKIDMSIVNSLISKEYSSSEIALILQHGNTSDINLFLNQDKHSDIKEYLNYDYAKLSNLERYIEYKSKNGTSYEETVTMVNLNLDKEFYTDYNEITEFSYTMLVNKYNKLSNNFVPKDLVSFSKEYCHGTCPMDNKTVVDAFEKMAEALLEEEKLHVYVNSAYRSYSEQEELYNRLTKLYGANYDVARAGFSEHQTGLVVDLASGSSEKFKDSKEEKWLKENAHKYGFIFRYDSSKVKITGYNEPWHFRYVGDIATDIYNSKLTFDEYYAKFLDK